MGTAVDIAEGIGCAWCVGGTGAFLLLEVGEVSGDSIVIVWPRESYGKQTCSGTVDKYCAAVQGICTLMNGILHKKLLV